MGETRLAPLQAGDKVALIAPARAVSPLEMAPFKLWLQSLELDVCEGENLYQRDHQFSGSDAQRATDFISAWTNPTIKAVFCGRGGYGCLRLMKHISDAILLEGKGKWLIGYSDITTLHLALGRLDMESIHGPMGINFFEPKPGSEVNFDFLQSVLFGEKPKFDLSTYDTVTSQPFQGKTIGGNLSLIYASLGSPDQPDTRGKILFIEDLDEYYYHVDRMMLSLDRAGLLSHLSALIVGGMTDMKDNMIPFGKNTKDIILEHAGQYGYPIIFDFPAGHGERNLCMKLNAFTTFDGKFLTQPS